MCDLRRAFKRIRMIFCKHQFPEYWKCSFDDTNTDGRMPSVTFWKLCSKCGKEVKVTMPIDNIIPAYEHLQKLRRTFK